MNNLFNPIGNGNLILRNRFVRSATYDGCAERSGRVSDEQIRLFSDLAAGGVALIVTGLTYVHASGQISAFQNSLAHDDSITSFKELTTVVHERGAKIAAQLFHAGRERAKFVQSKENPALAPSLLDEFQSSPESYRVMTEKDVWEVIHSFGWAAWRARESGFDAVQVHAAHGYLPSQFLSPLTNHRTDEWGGKLENRLRFHREIYQEIKTRVGQDYPVLIKIGVQDGLPNGLSFEEGKQAARLLSECGYYALEISLGLRGKGYANSEFRTQINGPDQEAYFREWCKEIKSEVKVPVMIVGGLRSINRMEEILNRGDADFISLCRPLIREPQLINRWEKDGTYVPKCISCNGCFEAILKRQPLHCVQERRKN